MAEGPSGVIAREMKQLLRITAMVAKQRALVRATTGLAVWATDTGGMKQRWCEKFGHDFAPPPAFTRR
jgi:hypothetical protein